MLSSVSSRFDDRHLLLHELPALESCDIRRIEFNPLTILALVCKSLVPIHLYANWVIRLDDVNRLGPLRKLDCYLARPSERVIRATDLVLPARAVLEEVNITALLKVGLRLAGLLPHAWCVATAKGDYGHILRAGLAELLKLGNELGLSAKLPCETVPVRKLKAVFHLKPNIGHGRETPQSERQLRVFVE